MPYTDANTISNPTTGQPILAAWGDQIRTNQEFFVDPPACSIYNSTTQSIATGATGTALNANSEYYDNDSMHSTVSNTSRITIQTAGRYLFIATVQFAANATGNRRLAFVVNGTTTHESQLIAATTSANSVVLTAPRSLVLAASDYVEVVVWQTSGGNLNVTLLEAAAMFQTR